MPERLIFNNFKDGILCTSTATTFHIFDSNFCHSSSEFQANMNRLDKFVQIVKEDSLGGMKIIETSRNFLPIVALVSSGDVPGWHELYVIMV